MRGVEGRPGESYELTRAQKTLRRVSREQGTKRPILRGQQKLRGCFTRAGHQKAHFTRAILKFVRLMRASKRCVASNYM